MKEQIFKAILQIILLPVEIVSALKWVLIVAILAPLVLALACLAFPILLVYVFLERFLAKKVSTPIRLTREQKIAEQKQYYTDILKTVKGG